MIVFRFVFKLRALGDKIETNNNVVFTMNQPNTNQHYRIELLIPYLSDTNEAKHELDSKLEFMRRAVTNPSLISQNALKYIIHFHCRYFVELLEYKNFSNKVPANDLDKSQQQSIWNLQKNIAEATDANSKIMTIAKNLLI